MKSFAQISILLVVPFLLGSISLPLLAADDAAGSVTVSDPYARAVPPGQPNSAAFMKLQNSSATDHAIVSAESAVSDIVELHTHVEQGGMMKMRQIEKIHIPSQGETVLQPGGLHVMFIDLKGDLKAGDKVSLTLVFEDGSKKEVEAPVRKLKMKMDKGMKKNMHKGQE